MNVVINRQQFYINVSDFELRKRSAYQMVSKSVVKENQSFQELLAWHLQSIKMKFYIIVAEFALQNIT